MIKVFRNVLWFFNGSERVRRRVNQVGQQVLESQNDSVSILAQLRDRLLPDVRNGRRDALSELLETMSILAARVEELTATLPQGNFSSHADRSASAAAAGPAPAPPGQAPPWSKPNYTEPRVLVAVRDLCKPGATVFDVGANFGGITVAMSRSVGPKGVVCAFEANPSIANQCQTKIIDNGCSNVQLYQGVVYSRSGETIELHLSENQVSDSIYHRGTGQSVTVSTLALDDFVEKTGLVPSFVKMDIEGAEYDALVGFRRTLEAHKPVLVLEQTPNDQRCIDLLKECGYSALDLSTYTSVQAMSDLPPETLITDILFAPTDWFTTSNYNPGTTKALEYTSGDFVGRSPNFLTSNMFNLPAGRYVVKAEYGSRPDDSEELFCGIWSESRDEALMQHHGHSASLSVLAHRWVFDAPNEDASIFFMFPRRRPESFKIDRLTVMAVDSLAGQAGHLVL